MTLRLNSAGNPVTGEPRHETEDGTDYLVVPVASSQEQVLSYPDDPNAYDREFLPGDELDEAVGRTNSLPISLDHPTAAPATPPSPATPDSGPTTVGEYRDLRTNSEGNKALGELWLPTDQRDSHGEQYTEAFDTLEDGGEWPVSLGYSIGEIDASGGRYNGQDYDAVQKSLTLDHLALVMNGKARCSVDAGCAAGRANAQPEEWTEAARGTPIGTGDSLTMSDQQTIERDKGRIAGALETLGSAIGVGVETRVNARSEARTPEYDSTLAEDDIDDGEFVSTHWMLDDYIDAYAEESDEDVPADVHSALSPGLSDEAREWITSHTLLGNADAGTESNLLVFNVVSPDGVLHESELRDVLGSDGARETLPEAVRESAREEAQRLLDEEFDDDGDDDRQNACESRDAPDEQSSDESADTDTADTTDTTSDTMTDTLPSDDDMIDYLANETEFDRKNAEKLRGEDCLGLTYERFNAEADAGGETTEGDTTEADTTDSPGEPSIDDTEGNEADAEESRGTSEEPDNEDATVTFESKEELADFVDEQIERRENSKECDDIREEIRANSEQFGEGDLVEANKPTLLSIREMVVDERENAQGDSSADMGPIQTQGPVRQNAELDTENAPDTPVAGDPWGDSGGNTEADD
ncbi:DUF2213 domain-containing protein [Halococcus saccharolyticus]|uniref:Uncharacterized protein n=1 Tax=Halococcus saccharolyticus DSM 5350 TaxID=1227455 RepID=M0MU93_9EURY|nr:DUF2213 domain-containing protein [Halococcus saccharolyticus]EMA48005.1 hypothetical protein C449_00995 [Halococcus saccharolyticus DSM 5350]